MLVRNHRTPSAISYSLALWGLLQICTVAHAQHTYYISKSLGADSNTAAQAQSKSSPWAHIPGQTGASGNASSYHPVAGDQFIFYGGDTWGNSDLGIIIAPSTNWSAGTSSSPIYVGVDKTWYNSSVCGASWCRPIFSCGASACTGTGNAISYLFVVESYVTIDNFEFKGLYTDGSGGTPSYVSTQLDHDIVENCYFHGWTVAPGSTHDFGQVTAFNNNNFSPYTSVGSGLWYSVIDGSDSSDPGGGADSMVAIGGAPDDVIGNYIGSVTNGLEGSATYVGQNYVTTIPVSFQAAAHQNAFQIAGPANSGETYGFIYNNVVTNVENGGIAKYWWAQGSGNSGTTWYVFNNVLFNVVAGNNINVCQLGTNCGTHYIFNNTWQCGNNSSTGDCIGSGATPAGTVTLVNNHCITGGLCINTTGHSFTSTETTDLQQTVATANSQGYTSSSTYAFQPTGNTGGTVGTGTNDQSLCTTISGLSSAAGSACQNDTGYACSYNTSNHTVTCPDRTELARPASAAWDIGAYQYGTSLNPPTALSAVAR